jgi:hypothetical protein
VSEGFVSPGDSKWNGGMIGVGLMEERMRGLATPPTRLIAKQGLSNGVAIERIHLL